MAVWATRERAEAAEAEVARLKSLHASLAAEVRAIPDHDVDGYEWEWSCENRLDIPSYPRTFPDCPSNDPEHNDELISRRRVLELLEKA